MQNSDTEHRTCTASQYTYTWKTQHAIQKIMYINSQSAKQNWNNKKYCYCYHCVCWQSSLPSSEEIFITGNSLCSAITFVSLITSYTNLATLKLDTHSSLQTWYTLFASNSYRFYTYTTDIPICNSVYEVHGLWMSWQFPLFFFEFADQPLWKHSVLFQCGPTANSVCICKFNPRQHTSTIRSSKHRRQMIKIIGPDYHPWSATNSARSFTFQPVSFGYWNVVG